MATSGSSSLGGAMRMARGLGWLGVGRGLVQLAASRRFAAAIGLGPGASRLVPALGARELVTGIGLLAHGRPAGWLWARVGGDVLDLVLLAVALRAPGAGTRRLAAATTAFAGVTALDVLAGRALVQRSVTGARPGTDAVRVERSITINRAPANVYRHWRDLAHLPRFMRHLASVRVTGERTSAWAARTPGGGRVRWDAEIVDDRPDELIAWRSTGGRVATRGSVRFAPAPGGRGTVVRVDLEYTPPAGLVGAMVARLSGADPAAQIADDLRRIKQLLETGEVATTAGQPSGREAHRARRAAGGARRAQRGGGR